MKCPNLHNSSSMILLCVFCAINEHMLVLWVNVGGVHENGIRATEKDEVWMLLGRP